MVREHLVFVANFQHTPNVDGLVWFARDVFPLVRRKLPGVHLKVVGYKVPEEVCALAAEDFEIVGHVPAIEPYLDAARVMIAPLRYGAGVKGKIGAALASGLPVVTTRIGAEGMRLSHGKNVLIADRPEEMATCIADAYLDDGLWQRLARKGGRSSMSISRPTKCTSACGQKLPRRSLRPMMMIPKRISNC